MSFCISESNKSNSYRPFVAQGGSGYVVIWTQESSSENVTELVSIYYDENKVAHKEHFITHLQESDEPHFFSAISGNRYVLAIEQNIGTKIVVLNSEGEMISNHFLPEKGLLLNLFTVENVIYFFMLAQSTVNIYRTSVGEENWSKAELMITHQNIYTIPHVTRFETGYLISWLNENEEIAYIFNTIYNTDNKIGGNTQILFEFDVDYLLTASVGAGIISFSGVSARDRIYRSVYVKWQNDEFVKISDRYWKSPDYKDRSFYVAPLKNGFLLMTDGGSDSSQVYIQRFTRANTFLNYLNQVDQEPMAETSCPEFVQGDGNCGLLVYVKQCGEYSEIFGKWISIGPIPELD